MQSRTKWVSLVVLIGAVAVAAILFFGGESPTETPPARTWKEVTVTRGPFRLVVSASGLVRPIDRIELKSKASGRVVELPVEVGDRVEKNALIARLDQIEERTVLSQARAQLDVARAELKLAEKNLERRVKLFTSDVIAEEIQDQTEVGLAVARGNLVAATADLARAEERMEDSVITAPVEGVILQKYVERGQIIASGISNVGGGTPIVDIADMRRVNIEAGVDEIDIGKIEVGQLSTIRADAYPEQVYSGKVVRIAPEARVEQNVTFFDVVAAVENTDGKLKSGMNTTMEVVIDDRSDVLTIPVTALQVGDAEGNGPFAAATVLVKADGDYVAREVRTGRTNYRVVEVLEGLEEGEVLGIPMVSRLKAEHDRLDARARSNRSFGADEAKKSPTPDRG